MSGPSSRPATRLPAPLLERADRPTLPPPEGPVRSREENSDSTPPSGATTTRRQLPGSTTIRAERTEQEGRPWA
ncbi:MAG: hypothetical protein LBM23_02640 [Propionibacteriaceae bacterium]|nr:hypothetical protein [Propionibacteriaceae bacterium]